MLNTIRNKVIQQKDFFKTQQTKNLSYRLSVLKKLRVEITKREKEICNALFADFRKSEFESLVSETQFVLAELSELISNLKNWAEPELVPSSLANFPSTDKIYNEPYGTVLVISPWNYPFQLAMVPLAGAIAAGNTAVVKPSELTPNTSKIISEIIDVVFDTHHVTVFEGGIEISQALLKEKWDYIFFTGSVQVGKIVYKAAAEHLTPVTLELGGKNPCIIDETANIKLAARRIVWGKFLNGGQTCIAPDYILIHPKVKSNFIKALETEITNAYGDNPINSEDFPRIINKKNFERLVNLLINENIVIGGKTNIDQLYISPTIVDAPKLNSELMKGEVFGPILPIITYKNEDDIDQIISSYNKPLSFYIFSKSEVFTEILLSKYSFGGGVINDTISNYVNKNLPFGGVGNSGMGAYHGKMSFDIFSHKKAVVKRGTWLDIPLRYAPYSKKLWFAKLVRKLF